MLLAVLALLPADAPPSLAGRYQVEQTEIGGGLELRPDGHFRYALSYGAADEEAEGRWTFDGHSLRLTSDPLPTAPVFEVTRDEPLPGCNLKVSVDWAPLQWSSPPDLIVNFASGRSELRQPQEDGTVALKTCAVSVAPLVPVYGTPTSPIVLGSSSGHRLSLKFVPHDLGKAAFRAEPLTLDGRDLMLERFDTKIRFVRLDP